MVCALRTADWRRKFHPAFPEIARANRQCEIALADWLEKWQAANQQLGKAAASARQIDAVLTPLLDERDALIRRIEVEFDAIEERHAGIPLPPGRGAFEYLHPATDESANEPGLLFRLLHWFRFAERVEKTIERDAAGDLSAYHTLTQSGEDVRRTVHARGPIAPFKRDVVHRQLLEIVSVYEMEPLTGQELAECFDEYCACGTQTHDEGALRKQYARLKDDLRRAQIPKT